MLLGIVSPTIGYEWIDEAAASSRGILVVNGAVPENQESMAEAAVLLLLAALYDLPGAQAELRAAGRRRTPPRMLKGKTVGLLGYGNIAKAMIARLQGWGADLIVHRRGDTGTDERVHFVSLAALLERSDALILLASLNEASRGIIDAAALDRMKKGAVLINIARGGILDEAALAKRLADGRLSMAALDVFETEPLPDGSPLRALSNAILTPHAIGHTVESFAAIPAAAIDNALALSRWEMPASARNRHIEKVWLGRRR
jgi:phosphoglycerate dehydrogenase-like enzyme